MAEIHVLSPHGLGSDQAARLEADLAHAREAGTDLGSRVPHIHAAGATLQQMADDLKRVVDQIQQELKTLGLDDSDMRRVLDQLVRTTAELGAGAKQFPMGT